MLNVEKYAANPEITHITSLPHHAIKCWVIVFFFPTASQKVAAKNKDTFAGTVKVTFPYKITNYVIVEIIRFSRGSHPDLPIKS